MFDSYGEMGGRNTRVTGRLISQLACSAKHSRVKTLPQKLGRRKELTPKSSELYICAIAHFDACGHVQYNFQVVWEPCVRNRRVFSSLNCEIA